MLAPPRSIKKSDAMKASVSVPISAPPKTPSAINGSTARYRMALHRETKGCRKVVFIFYCAESIAWFASSSARVFISLRTCVKETPEKYFFKIS